MRLNQMRSTSLRPVNGGRFHGPVIPVRDDVWAANEERSCPECGYHVCSCLFYPVDDTAPVDDVLSIEGLNRGDELRDREGSNYVVIGPYLSMMESHGSGYVVLRRTSDGHLFCISDLEMSELEMTRTFKSMNVAPVSSVKVRVGDVVMHDGNGLRQNVLSVRNGLITLETETFPSDAGAHMKEAVLFTEFDRMKYTLIKRSEG